MSARAGKKHFLEAWKFAVYVSIPVFLTVAIALTPSNLEKVVRNRSYVVYPPENPRPPTSVEAIHNAARQQSGQ